MPETTNQDWSRDRIDQLIADGVEENLTLDYKAAGSLAKTDSKRKEITKDVSAFANSAGGTVIYGVREHKSRDLRHLPEKIDPVNRAEYSKEWIEHVVQNIRPRVENIRIFSVEIDNAANSVVYVVEIPQSNTAHQAQDLRYYRRFNFESVPMADHEIRDVMNRSRHPDIEVSLAIQIGEYGYLHLVLFYQNIGKLYASYVNGFVSVATAILEKPRTRARSSKLIEGQECKTFDFENIHKDIVQRRDGMPPIPDGMGGMMGVFDSKEFYVTRYDPILPGLGRYFFIGLGIEEAELPKHQGCIVRWSLFADNAPERKGTSRLGDLPLEHELEEI